MGFSVERELMVLIYLRPSILESILGFEVKPEYLEFPLNGSRRIDLIAQGNQMSIMVEAQIIDSQLECERHYKQIIDIINNDYDGYVLIWMSTIFEKKHITDIKKLIVESGKSIDLYIVQLSDELIQNIRNLEIDELTIEDQLQTLSDVSNDFITISSLRNSNIGSREDDILSLYNFKHKTSDFLAEILALLKSRCQLTTLKNFKNLENGSFSVGLGVSDISLVVGIDRLGFEYSSVNFGEPKQQIYYLLKKKEAEVINRFGTMILFDDSLHKIIMRFPKLKEVNNTVWFSIQVSRMIEYFYRQISQIVKDT